MQASFPKMLYSIDKIMLKVSCREKFSILQPHEIQVEINVWRLNDEQGTMKDKTRKCIVMPLHALKKQYSKMALCLFGPFPVLPFAGWLVMFTFRTCTSVLPTRAPSTF